MAVHGAPRPGAITVTLEKIDLIDRKFATSLLGYNREEVDAIVAEAAESIGRLAEEKMELSRRVEELRREVAGYQSREATLRDTLLTTQTIVEDVKAKAHREAESLLDAAKDQAAALVREAEQEAATLEAQIDILRKRKATLTGRFREMLLSALDIVDADQAEDAKDDAATPEFVLGLADATDVEDTSAGDAPQDDAAATSPRKQPEETE